MTIHDKLARWRYRRMAWRNDLGLFMDMHPRLAWLIDQYYEHSWPLRKWIGNVIEAARDHKKEKTMRMVYNYGPNAQVKYWKDSRSATQINAEARAQRS